MKSLKHQCSKEESGMKDQREPSELTHVVPFIPFSSFKGYYQNPKWHTRLLLLYLESTYSSGIAFSFYYEKDTKVGLIELLSRMLYYGDVERLGERA